MKKAIPLRSRTAEVLVLVLTLVLVAEVATTEAKDVEADIAAIKEGGNQYVVTMNTGDLEHWLSLHTDDIVKMGPGAPSVIGQEQLREKMEPLFDSFTFQMTINSEEIQVASDWGFDRGTYRFLMTPKEEGEPISLVDGKYLTIYKKQADGSWKISHDCYNSNVPPK